MADPSQASRSQEKAAKSTKSQVAAKQLASATKTQAKASKDGKGQLAKTGSGFGVIGLALSSLLAGLGLSRKRD